MKDSNQPAIDQQLIKLYYDEFIAKMPEGCLLDGVEVGSCFEDFFMNYCSFHNLHPHKAWQKLQAEAMQWQEMVAMSPDQLRQSLGPAAREAADLMLLEKALNDESIRQTIDDIAREENLPRDTVRKMTADMLTDLWGWDKKEDDDRKH